MSDALVRLFGWSATLFHGDPMVLDRWRWLKRRLPRTRGSESLIDVGCGTGAYTIGAARSGYRAVGLSWDERNQAVAERRAGSPAQATSISRSAMRVGSTSSPSSASRSTW